MLIEKHHTKITTVLGIIVIAYIISSVFLLNEIDQKQRELTLKIDGLQADTQNKLNELTESILATREDLSQTKVDLSQLGTEVGTIGEEFGLLKASVGEDFSGIIEEAVKGVVTIKTDVAQGTGFIISSDGYLVTNAHVLVGGNEVTSSTYDLEKIPTSFIGYNSELDVALLKIQGTYQKLELFDSDNVQVGEKVIAIGNPLGLQFSVSEGIISGTHREGIKGLNAYIQTDASLNPGNSGGPLINRQGKVVGINNFKIGSGEGLGFALESNYLKDAVNEIALESLGYKIIS